MSRWRALKPWLGAAAAFVGLTLFVWLSIQVYRSKTDPENFRLVPRPC